MCDKLEVFLKQAIGKSYNLRVKDAVFRKESKNLDNDISDDRTFFCSELIAKAYKILGFTINDNTPCSRTFPSHFSEKG
jgi:hypothetical protein